MTASLPHIVVCICTYKRPDLLRRLLLNLFTQETAGQFAFSVVVADNDKEESAREVVTQCQLLNPIPIQYCTEARQNIALVRNRALENATGEYVAFIDDDEFPTVTWLQELLGTCREPGVAGVLGPVRPHFDEPPPEWIVKGKFCERPEYKTGTRIPWEESRTGNVLFKRAIIQDVPFAFDEKFGNGGEDKDFFMRMENQGHVFVWCNEAPVYETVPPDRWSRSYMLRRALLRGKNILKHPTGKAGLLLRSLAAIPIYLLGIPIFLACGQHILMKYCVKLCDHVGRILALLRINPVNER